MPAPDATTPDTSTETTTDADPYTPYAAGHAIPCGQTLADVFPVAQRTWREASQTTAKQALHGQWLAFLADAYPTVNRTALTGPRVNKDLFARGMTATQFHRDYGRLALDAYVAYAATVLAAEISADPESHQ